MSDEMRNRAKERLTAERRKLQRLHNDMNEGQLEGTLGESISELSLYDNHPADVGTETFERSKDLALSGLVERRMNQVDDALAAIERGSYGTCENCGEAIPEARLEAAPETTLCVDCRAELYDTGFGVSARPVEEDVLKPAFGRTFKDDDPEEQVGYDGEDAWQEVARYGTSNTPSDVPGSPTVQESFVDSDERHGAVEETDTLFVDEEEDEDGQLKATREKRSER